MCPVVGRLPQNAASKLVRLALASARSCCFSICPGCLCTDWSESPFRLAVSSFIVIWYPSGDARGPSDDVFEAVYLPCPAPLHFSHIANYVYEFCPLSDPDVDPSIHVCDAEHTYTYISSLVFGPFQAYVPLNVLARQVYMLDCAAASLFCACLASVQVSAPCVIAGSTQELYTCLFRQMARLLLKISRCLAYAVQPALILCCRPYIFSWLFASRL